jgi:hypothetical protein
MSPANRTQIELEMRNKLLEAQLTYQSAAARTKALTENLGNSPQDQGNQVDLQQAKSAEAYALEKYRTILKEFTDLVLRGKQLA